MATTLIGRIPRGWQIVGFTLASWALLIALMWGASELARAGQVTMRQILGDARYWPPACSDTLCVLTGLGGYVPAWERHVDRNRGKRFVVRGLCASACEIAARRANAEVMPGARLVPHEPSPAIWR